MYMYKLSENVHCVPIWYPVSIGPFIALDISVAVNI